MEIRWFLKLSTREKKTVVVVHFLILTLVRNYVQITGRLGFLVEKFCAVQRALRITRPVEGLYAPQTKGVSTKFVWHSFPAHCT